MKLHLVTIDVPLPRWLRPLLVGLAVPLGLLGVGVGAVLAAGSVTIKTDFADGTPLSAKQLNDNFGALQSQGNDHESRLAALEAEPSCPHGYTRVGTAASFLTASTLCSKGVDQVLKVGVGASAFWVDRYEATAWTTATGSPGSMLPDADPLAYGFAGLQPNGQGAGVYALSVTGVVPSRSLTWFQAAQACRASGKRLPTGEEWLAAARGTFDAVVDGSGDPRCNTLTSKTGPRATGAGAGGSQVTSCVSDWGAEDMIGNVWEWTAEWFAAPPPASPLLTTIGSNTIWPDPAFANDVVWNVGTQALVVENGPTWKAGTPGAAQHGGMWSDGTAAGTFALIVSTAPSEASVRAGFRCVVPAR